MITKTKTLIGAALAAGALAIAPASAVGDLQPAGDRAALADTYNGCGIGGGYGYRGSYRGGYHGSYRGGSHYRSGYSHSYRDRCRVIDRDYFFRGHIRYCRVTYLHERVDCYGRVIRCWRSCKTIRH